ncbi:MAG TPA: methyltransferase domain-containing protein [Polyangia bacterium]
MRVGGASQSRRWTERVRAWLVAGSRARLLPRRRALLKDLDGEGGKVLTLERDRAAPDAQILVLLRQPRASLDAVVSLGALADADDVDELLREVMRVLRPGGRLLFVEPVAAPAGTWARRLQKAWAGGWRLLAGSLKAPSDLWNDLKVARFDRLMVERRTLAGLGGWPVPHVVGQAVLGSSPAEGAGPGSAAPLHRASDEVLATSFGPPPFAFFG